MAKPYERCYPGGENKGAMILGYALVLAGVILLIVEAFMPGFGVPGISGIILLPVHTDAIGIVKL